MRRGNGPKPARAEVLGIVLACCVALMWALVAGDAVMMVLGSPGASVGTTKLVLAGVLTVVWWFGLPFLRRKL